MLSPPFIRDYREPGVTFALVPFAADPTTSLAFAEDALRSRLAPGEEMAELFPPIDSSIRSAHATGGLVRSNGAPSGMVLWEPAGPVGVAVRLLYLADGAAVREGYRAVLDLTERAAGPVAFAPGQLAGLSETAEAALMEERGFAPYGRSEMTFPAVAPLPVSSVPADAEVRAVTPSDEAALARLHERAYARHLDRYLAIEDLDPVRDADRQMRGSFSGRWGDLLIPGSTVVTVGGEPVAAVLVARRPTSALVLDAMTEPRRQGRGYGRAALASALRALRERGESRIVLNVTEGNERALRLYGRLGFVRSLGPSKEWYDARRMPVDLPVPPRRQAPGTGSDGR